MDITIEFNGKQYEKKAPLTLRRIVDSEINYVISYDAVVNWLHICNDDTDISQQSGGLGFLMGHPEIIRAFISEGALVALPEEYSVGQVFRINGCGMYLLAQVGYGECAFINLGWLPTAANRHSTPVKVAKTCYNISRKELIKMAGGSSVSGPINITVKEVK